MTLISAFETRLNLNIVSGLVKLGHYEKEGLSLALGSTAWNIVIISPHSAIEQSGSLLRKKLAINRDISAIETAKFDQNNEILLIGTRTNLLAYNIETNSDIFYKDVPDGVNVILFCAELSDISNGVKEPIIVIGGNCSIQAFNRMGKEIFWTVTSDNVICMAECDIDKDGHNELLIGSQDCTIKAFKGQNIVYSITESDVVTHLQSLGNDCYAYALRNGTIGVYVSNNKLWKVQKKEQITSLNVYNCHLILGWSDSLIEVAQIQNGKVLWNAYVCEDKDSSAGIAGIVCGNLNGINNSLLTISTNGIVKAWIADTDSKEKETNGVNESKRKRDELCDELKYLRNNYKILRSKNMSNDPSLIPSNTEISCTLTPSIEQRRLLLIMSTNNSTVIKCVLIYGDKVFKNGSLLIHISKQYKSSITIPLSFEKDLQCNLSIRAIVGHISSVQNHVFELSHRIPRFASYLYIPTLSIPKRNKPISYTTFVCSERMNRLILWLNQAFLLEYEQNTKKTIDISFVSLRNGKYITLQCDNNINIKIMTENVTLCGDIIQDIAQYLSITELESICDFSPHFQDLKGHMTMVEEYNDIRNRLSIDIASNTSVIKNIIVKSNDSRIQKNYSLFKKQFSDLFDINNDMCSEFIKRQNNHKNLIKSLKLINKTIQQISRLRVGKYQKMTVSLARQAVKNKNSDALINVLQYLNFL